MTKTNAAPANASKGAWMSRFGLLEDVTERQSQKGPFITFKLQCKGFVQYGACFDEKIIPEMKAAVGKNVWMRGPLDDHMGRDTAGNPTPRKSYKVITFRLSEDKAPTSEEEVAQAA